MIADYVSPSTRGYCFGFCLFSCPGIHSIAIVVIILGHAKIIHKSFVYCVTLAGKEIILQTTQNFCPLNSIV